MEAVGNIILSLHRNLQEIQSSLASGTTENRGRELLLGVLSGGFSLEAGGVLRFPQRISFIKETALKQSTIDRAEAHALVTAARVAPRAPHLGNQSNSLAASLSTEYIPPRKRSSSGPPPPRPVRPIAPPATGRAASTGQRRPVRQPTGGHQRSGKTTNRKRLLPKMNRLDPLADPPALTESDLETGLLDLAMRGFIPQTADLTPAMERGMPCLMQQPAAFYDQGMKQLPRLDEAEHLTQVKLDLRAHILRTLAPPEEIPAQSDSFKAHPRLPPLPGRPPNAMPASAMPALPSGPGAGSVAEAYGTFCTELLEAVDVADLEVPALPPPPTQAEIEAAAVTRISASWRGCCQRRRYAEHLRKHNAAVRIQSGWHTCCIRSATRKELLRKEEEERKVQTMMMYQLGQDWFQAKALRRVEVHVCSLSIAEHRRRHMDSYQVLQASQIARIFRLADSKRDIIFVAPKHIHEDVLDYYSKIMQFRGIQNPPGRFQVVVPENMDMKDKFSLTQALLCSPKALKRIGRLVRNRMAMLIPEVVTHLEAKLSNTLRLPLIGPSARNMSLLSSKSNGKKLAQMAQLPIGPWAVDIYDEDEFYNSLAGLVVKHPEVRTWLFKIDDERSSRGTAYIDLLKMQQVSHSAHASAPALLGGGGHEDLTEPAVIGADAGEVRAMLQHYVPRRVTLCNRQVYGDFASWLAEACRIGCVIQAVPEHLISQTSVHFQVAPDGAVDVLGTSETVTSTPFVRAASWYPHTRGSYQVLQEVGLRLGRSLAAKGLVGFASADVVFFDNPNFDVAEQSLQEHRDSPAIIGSDTPVNPEDLMFADLRSPSPDMSVATGEMPGPVELPQSRQADYEAALCHQEYYREQRPMDPVSLMLGVPHQVGASSASPFACWLVDIDVRLTDEAAMLFPLKFIGQVKSEPSQGLLHLTPEAAQSRELDTLYDLTEEERSSRLQRWAMITHVAAAPQLERMSHQVLFQAAKMRGVSFDLFHNTGCIFTFLDVVHNLFSLMAVEKSPEACARKMSAALAAIAEGPKGVVGAKAPRPLKVGAGEATDLLTLADVQMALRICTRRFTEQKQ